MDLKQERIDILRAAFEQRSRDVMFHQINIDNFCQAIALLAQEARGDENLSAFAKDLEQRLAHERAQQAREQVLLTVITRQLEDANVRSA